MARENSKWSFIVVSALRSGPSSSKPLLEIGDATVRRATAPASRILLEYPP